MACAALWDEKGKTCPVQCHQPSIIGYRVSLTKMPKRSLRLLQTKGYCGASDLLLAYSCCIVFNVVVVLVSSQWSTLNMSDKNRQHARHFF